MITAPSSTIYARSIREHPAAHRLAGDVRRLAHAVAEFEVDWKRAALVVIDMQNYGCNPEAGLGPMLAERYPEIAGYYMPRVTQTAIPNARRLLEGFRAAGRPVVFTRHGPLLADGSDMIARRRRRDVEALASTGTPALWHRGTFEHELIAALAPRPASW